MSLQVVVKAYLEGKEDILRQHCTDELLERLMGLYRHSEAQGTFQDSTLLFINDVELLDAMFVEKQPVIVVTFSCQQINCMRDKFGNVVDGKEDEIQQVCLPINGFPLQACSDRFTTLGHCNKMNMERLIQTEISCLLVGS